MKRLFTRHIIITAVFFAAAVLSAPARCLYAQEVTDTTVVTDEDVEKPPPPKDIVSEGESTDKKQKQYFDVKTNDDSFTVQERRLPAGYGARLKEDKDFWYADKSFNKKKEAVKEDGTKESEYIPLGQRTWVQTLLWLIIIAGFATAIAFYLADSNVGLFRKKNVAANNAGTGEEEMPEDIFAINYQKEIDKAVAQGNFRMAIRLNFLRMLRTLSDKNIIQYKQDRTNLDYLMQLHGSKHYPSFFRLTRHFEYAWYGQFEVSREAYQLISGEYNQFDKSI